jgi:dienelactone hydrolase
MEMTRMLLKPWRVMLPMLLLAQGLGAVWAGAAEAASPQPGTARAPWPAHHGQVQSQLYLGEAESSRKRPLLVALGGAEGGNAWAGPRAEAMRQRFLADGYAVLALAYFGLPGIPAQLDRIDLQGVREAIFKAAHSSPQIEPRCIAVIGGSKGAELALLLASRSPEIKAVAAVVPGSAVFVGHTETFDTSSFSDQGEELPFVPLSEAAVPALIAGDKRKVFDLMMQDSAAMARARIPVERINGPVFFLSATQDELWDSKAMSEQMMATLQRSGFAHAHAHTAIEGGHSAPMRKLNLARDFLNTHFLPQVAGGCVR